MVVPLAPPVLDLMFTLNIAIAIVVLLGVVYVLRPMDFSSFPTVLLFVTLLRLALNVASTRVVLLHGHEGTHAAGRVIEAFGNFVVGGNYARSEEHTSELQSLMRNSYAVFCLKKKR